MTWSSFPAVLAAGNIFLVKLVLFAVLMLVGSLVKFISDRREQAERLKSARPQQAPPKRDNQFRSEIEAFLEEVGRRRTLPDQAQRPVASRTAVPVDPSKVRPAPRPELRRPPAPPRPLQSAGRPKPEASKPVPPTGPPPRPGAEIAARKSPVSQNLGGQVRAHLAEYLDSSRMANQVQSDVGNAVERTVRQHLGETITRGTSEKEQSAQAATGPNLLASLLRDPSGMRSAILVNEILGRPKGLRRKA